eukprot:3964616-Pleurochrysis_carterae.AAC.1
MQTCHARGKSIHATRTRNVTTQHAHTKRNHRTPACSVHTCPRTRRTRLGLELPSAARCHNYGLEARTRSVERSAGPRRAAAKHDNFGGRVGAKLRARGENVREERTVIIIFRGV